MGLLRRLRSSVRGKSRHSGGQPAARHNGTPAPTPVTSSAGGPTAASDSSQPAAAPVAACYPANDTTPATPSTVAGDGGDPPPETSRSGETAAADEVTLRQLASLVFSLQAEVRELRRTVSELRVSLARADRRAAVSVGAASQDEFFFDALTASLLSLRPSQQGRPLLLQQLSLPAGARSMGKMLSDGPDSGQKQSDAELKREADVPENESQSSTVHPSDDPEKLAGDKSEGREESAKPEQGSKTEESAESVKHPEPLTEPSQPANGYAQRQQESAPSADLQEPVRVETAESTALTALPASVPPATGECHGDCRRLGHPLAEEIDRVMTSQLAMAASEVEGGAWSLFAEDGPMRMYRQEAPADNHSVDPLKALHSVSGVTARELCRHYWDAGVRMDWETTVDRVTVLARLDPSTLLVHQLHKRVWPAQQRDTLFWSHLCRRRVNGVQWNIVVNHSVRDHPLEPRALPGCVRAIMTSCLAGHTEPVVGSGAERADLRCHLAYSSQVEPGGWAPTAALRLIYKREYPRFLKCFTNYVILKCREDPIEW